MSSEASRAPAYTPSDGWSSWLLDHRYGGDADWQRHVEDRVAVYADKVLDACGLRPGMTLADIGCGDGTVAFRAIRRTGALRAVLVDISAPLLRHARESALAAGLAAQCSFVEASAERLAALPDASVDAVVTRAALAYVADKRAALREFHRVLKPGGRVSVCEPLMQDDAVDTVTLRRIVEARGHLPGHELLPLLHRWKAAQYPDTLAGLRESPIANYSERDLFGFIRDAGFVDAHLELHLDSRPIEARPWQAFLQASPHPCAPTNGAILERCFDAPERERFEALMRPAVEAGGEIGVERLVYASASKPTG